MGGCLTRLSWQGTAHPRRNQRWNVWRLVSGHGAMSATARAAARSAASSGWRLAAKTDRSAGSGAAFAADRGDRGDREGKDDRDDKPETNDPSALEVFESAGGLPSSSMLSQSKRLGDSSTRRTGEA